MVVSDDLYYGCSSFESLSNEARSCWVKKFRIDGVMPKVLVPMRNARSVTVRYQKQWAVIPNVDKFLNYLRAQPLGVSDGGEVVEFDSSDIRLYVEKNTDGDIVFVEVERPVGSELSSVDELWDKIPGESKEWAELMGKINNKYVDR